MTLALARTKLQKIVDGDWPVEELDLGKDGVVRVAALDQKDALLIAQVRKRIEKGELPPGSQVPEVLRLGIIDKDGKPVFKSADAVNQSAISVKTALKIAAKIDEITEYPEPPKKAEDGAEGNSEASQSESSSSASPSP